LTVAKMFMSLMLILKQDVSFLTVTYGVGRLWIFTATTNN